MQTENTKLHAEMALIIKSAKRRLFKRHREGMDLAPAIDQFIEECTQNLTCAMPEPEKEDRDAQN